MMSEMVRCASFVLATFALLGCASSPSPAPIGETTNPEAPASLSDQIALTKDDTIFTTSARTVDFNGQAFIPRVSFFRSTGLYDGNERVGDPAGRELSVLVTTLRGVIGLDPDLTVLATVPFVVKRLRTRIGGRRVSLESEGLGDIPLVAKWRFFKDPELAGTTEMALLGGLKLPTGQSHVRDGGMRLPRPLQPGSGSVDGILGVAFTRLWGGGRWLINADTIFKLNTESDDYRFGNQLRFDVGGQYRIYPARYESYDQTTVNLLLELNGDYRFKDELAGFDLDGTGGLKMFLSPGVQVIIGESLLVEAGVQIPIYRDLNGPQLGEDFRATLGLRWRF